MQVAQYMFWSAGTCSSDLLQAAPSRVLKAAPSSTESSSKQGDESSFKLFIKLLQVHKIQNLNRYAMANARQRATLATTPSRTKNEIEPAIAAARSGLYELNSVRATV